MARLFPIQVKLGKFQSQSQSQPHDTLVWS